MSTTRDPKGRFKSKEPDNPDKELATKGFVKCIARSVMRNSSHSYNTGTDDLRTNLGAASMLGIAIFGASLIVGGGLNSQSVWSPSLAIGAAISGAIFIYCLLTSDETEDCKISEEYPDSIIRYDLKEREIKECD